MREKNSVTNKGTQRESIRSAPWSLVSRVLQKSTLPPASGNVEYKYKVNYKCQPHSNTTNLTSE